MTHARQPSRNGKPADPAADNNDATHGSALDFQARRPVRWRRREIATMHANASADSG
jgi:hypothetical protein